MAFDFLFPLRELISAEGVKVERLAQELEFDVERLRQMYRGHWERLSRTELRKLAVWAAKKGYELPVVCPSALWQPFEGSKAKIYRAPAAPGIRWDARAETEIQEFVNQLRCRCDHSQEPASEESVREAIQTRNCVFIGSPKTNRATEYALALILGIRAWDPADRSRAPFRFRWPDPLEAAHSTFADDLKTDKLEKSGVLIRTQGAMKLVPLNYMTTGDFIKYSGKGTDVAIVAACRSPMGTKEPVMTVVIAGFSGFSTYELTKAITVENVPVFPYAVDKPSRKLYPDVRDGKPVIRVFAMGYEKHAGTENRSPVLGSQRWMDVPL